MLIETGGYSKVYYRDGKIIKKYTSSASEGLPDDALHDIVCYSSFANIKILNLSILNRENLEITMPYNGSSLNKYKVMKTQIKSIVFQLIRLLHHVHKHHIIHRDIKPANILIDTNGRIRLIDYGICTFGDISSIKEVYSEWFRAPEFYSDAFPKYSQSADVWALGITLFELVVGSVIFPYRGEKRRKELNLFYSLSKSLDKTIYHLYLNSLKSTEILLYDLILKMITEKPSERLDIEECLNHPYLKGFTVDYKLDMPKVTYYTKDITQKQHIENIDYVYAVIKRSIIRYNVSPVYFEVIICALHIFYQLHSNVPKSLDSCVNLSIKLMSDTIDSLNYNKLSNMSTETEMKILEQTIDLVPYGKSKEDKIQAFLNIANWNSIECETTKDTMSPELKMYWPLLSIQ